MGSCPASGGETDTASGLTAESRYVLGEAAAPTLHIDPERELLYREDLSEQRALGWAIAEDIVGPVEVEVDGETRRIPRFQTFYDEEDLRRVYLALVDDAGPTASDWDEAALDRAFAHNTRAVLDYESWPEDRLTAFIDSLESDPHLFGAGGIARVLYGPSAARHLLRSDDALGACEAMGGPQGHIPSPIAPPGEVTVEVDVPACGEVELGPYDFARDTAFVITSDASHLEARLSDGRLCESDSGRDVICRLEGPGQARLTLKATGSRAEAATVTYTPRTPLYTPCVDGEFPEGATIVKALYRRSGFGITVPVYDTSRTGLAALIMPSGNPVDSPAWGEGAGESDPGPDDIFTLTLPGDQTYRLVALHVMTKAFQHWVWTSLWWSASGEDFAADRPEGFAGGFFQEHAFDHYKMCNVTDFERPALPAPEAASLPDSMIDALELMYAQSDASFCSNPFLEDGPGNMTTNCVGCHQHAGGPASQETILENHALARVLSRENFPSDYVYSAADTRTHIHR